MFETSDNTSKIFTVLFLLTAFTIGLTTNSLAYTPTHPLSDITPMDVPLALDGQPIQAGDGQYVVIEDELVVQSDLDMSDQDIENVGNLTAFFTESCPDGELVKGVEDDGEVVCGSAEGEVDDIFVHRTGDQMEGDLDFDGQNILRAGDITVENDGGTHISVLEESEYPSTVQFQAADDEWQVGTRGEDEFYIGMGNTGSSRSGLMDSSVLTASETGVGVSGVGERFSPSYRLDVSGDARISSGLDMAGSSISGINELQNYFGDACGEGFVALGVDDDGEIVCGDIEGMADEEFVHQEGDYMTGDLDMRGNNILDVGSLVLDDGGSVDSLSGGSVGLSADGVQSVYLDGGNQFVGVGTSSPSHELDVVGSGRFSLDLNVGGDLDMETGDISGINEIQNYFGDACGEGYSAKGVNDDGEIICGELEGEMDAAFVHQEGDYMTGDLDMTGNNILDVGSLVLDDGGSVDSLSGGSVGLSADGVQSVYLDGGNQFVGVGTSSPSYRLDVSGDARVSDSLNVGGGLDMESGDISNINELSGFFGDACGVGSYAKGVNDDGSIVCEDIEDEVDDEFVHQTGDYMTGDLDMRGNNVLDVGTLNTEDVSASGDVLAEGRVVASAEEDQITLAHNNDPSNERWKMRYTDDYDDWSFILEDVTNDVPRFGVGRQSNTDRSFINPEQGNFGVGTRSPSSTLDVSGDARISSGLDMAGSSISGINELQNYFGDACGEGSYAKGVDDDGDIVCDPFDEGDIDDHFVHQEGDYMTGDLDMRGNNILDVGGMSLEHSVDINTPTDAGRLLGIYGYGDTHELGIHYQTYGSNVYEFDTTEDRDIAFMPDSDRIGINTASPDYELDVDGTVYAGNGIVVGGSDSHSYQGIRSEDDHLMFDAPSGSNTYVNWDSGDGFYVGGSDVELADDNQPVGVGTGRSPDSQLHVGGDTKVDGDIEINDGQASGTNKVKGDRELYAADETEISGGTKELTLVFNEDYGHSPSHVNVIARVDGSISITIDGNEETLSGENEIDEATWDTSDWGDGTYDVYVDIPAGDMNDVIEFYYVH